MTGYLWYGVWVAFVGYFCVMGANAIRGLWATARETRRAEIAAEQRQADQEAEAAKDAHARRVFETITMPRKPRQNVTPFPGARIVKVDRNDRRAS